MIIILTTTDIKDTSTGKLSHPKNLTLDDFFVGLKGWPYLVAFVHHERAHILKQGNWTGNEATSINKLWQLISRHLEWCKEEDPTESNSGLGHNFRPIDYVSLINGEPPAGAVEAVRMIVKKQAKPTRRFGLKLPPAFKALGDE